MDWQRKIGRETVGGILLAVLLLLGLLTGRSMRRTHWEISRKLEDAAWFALSENWEDARVAAAAAEGRWKGCRNRNTLLADHTPMEQIVALFSRVGILSAARQQEEFAATCAELSRYVQAMGEAHRLTWQNLL